MWWLKWRLNANLCEQRRLWRVCTFAQAYLSHRHCTKSLVLPKMAICVLFTQAANTLVSLHICAGKVTRHCGKYLDLLCWQRSSWESARLHRLAWAFVTVSEYHVLAEMAIFVTFMWTANDVASLHQQPQDFCATISALYQCVKKCSQCVVIKFLNKTFASLPRKKYKVVIVFLDVI